MQKMERAADRQRQEVMKVREEASRKMEIHKQQVKAMEEAEYKIYDAERAKTSDEAQWMDFESRTR